MTNWWASMIGQERAVQQLQAWVADPVHAYLFVGPAGAGKRQAARAFSASIQAHGLEPDAADRQGRLALGDIHPDVELFTPEGRNIDVDTVKVITPMVFKKPVEGRRRIVIIDRLHAATPAAAASLLKTVEEPPLGAIIILLAERIIPEHVAIASRAVEIPFPAVADDAVAQALIDSGTDPETAARIASAVAGDTERARLLVEDAGFAARSDAWESVPARLDGTGSTVGRLVDELRAMIDEAVAVLEPRHVADVQQLTEREEQLGTRGSGRKELEARHKREIRKVRDDELRYGLGVLARAYRDQLAAGGDASMVQAVTDLRSATDALGRNPAEALLLLDLFWRLPSLTR